MFRSELSVLENRPCLKGDKLVSRIARFQRNIVSVAGTIFFFYLKLDRDNVISQGDSKFLRHNTDRPIRRANQSGASNFSSRSDPPVS